MILRAKRDALLGLPKMWRKRKTIQATRIATTREIWRMLDKHIVPARDGTDWKGCVVVPEGE
ncbi:MAG: hypothetical protein U0236_00470 [Nitrospira sp.]